MTTPASVLAAIPDDLLQREERPTQQNKNAAALAYWLLERGHRPTLLEIERERARRSSDAA